MSLPSQGSPREYESRPCQWDDEKASKDGSMGMLSNYENARMRGNKPIKYGNRPQGSSNLQHFRFKDPRWNTRTVLAGGKTKKQQLRTGNPLLIPWACSRTVRTAR